MKSRWEALGFDSEVFELFVRMRGGKTRVKLLNSLLIPKDRFQLAQELGLDWKAVDRHMAMLDKYGFVHEQASFGRVRIYELTTVGKMLLKLLQNLNEQDGEDAFPLPAFSSSKPEV
jgi:predicted ArsR family transcriptional regulator